jgi:predicted DNA-binding antitoxin AbrB/MazE fold protein
MTMTIHAIYENGVLRPIETLNLPDQCEVEVEVRSIKPDTCRPNLDEVYAILSKRFNSGENDVAERHNEPQP